MRSRLFAMLLALAISSLNSAWPRESHQSWEDATLKSLTLREKIGQLIHIRIPGKFLNRQSAEFLALQDAIKKNKVGGVVLFAGDIYESAVLINDLQTASKLPLIVSSDFERGAAFRIADTTSFPWTMAIGATGSEAFAYQQGYITAKESRAMGVHWLFAPVVDVNNNPDNPVINIRSFGEDPSLVSRLSAAFIRGAKKGGALTTAKHFPGHGDTATDTHIGLAVVPSTMERLEKVELPPFRSAIEAGVDAIMTAHVAVPQVTNSSTLPATLSSKILTDLLRQKLNFQGVVVTDALEMGAISNTYWAGLAAINALKAGADILLLPQDPSVAINEVARAVVRGDIAESRIDASARKILALKSRLGLNRVRTVSLKQIGESVASPGSLKLGQDIADKSIVAVKDEKHLLPIDPRKDPRILNIILASDTESSPASIFQTEMHRRFPSAQNVWGNLRTSTELLSNIDKNIAEADLIICSTLTRLSSGQDSSFPESQKGIIRKLIASAKPVIWVSFGSPYVLRLAPEIGTYICAFSYADVSQIAAAKALSGEIPISGHMPVSIPGQAKLGDGLQIPKLDMTLNFGANTVPSVIPNLSAPADALLIAAAKNSVTLKVGLDGVFPKSDPFFNRLNTVSAAMLAIDSSILIPKSLVRDYLPELDFKGGEKLKIADLLSDLSGNQTTAGGKQESNQSLIKSIISRAAGAPANDYVQSHLWSSLGNKATASFSATDLAAFSQMILNGGIYNHRRFLSKKTITSYAVNSGLWTKPDDSFFSATAFGLSSPSGSFLWIDPEKELFIEFLISGKGTFSKEEVGSLLHTAIKALN